MPVTSDDFGRATAISERFTTTQWGLVAAAGGATSIQSHEAMSELCQRYWFPLYAYIRHRGYRAGEAEDLTQGFFAMLLETKTLGRADRSRGRFRSYLLGALKHFLADEADRLRMLKRGGGRKIISLDADAAEGRFLADPVDPQSPERLFDRQWGLTVLNLALSQLRQQYAEGGKGPLFERLQGYMIGEGSDTSYREAGNELGISEGAVKVAVHRLRRKYRDLIRAHIAETVESPAEVDDEIRHLFHALRV